MELTSKHYDYNDEARANYAELTKGKVYKSRYTREQNGAQQDAGMLSMWASMPMSFRLEFDKRALGSGYSGYSMFVDIAYYTACAQVAFEHSATFDFAHYGLGTFE